MNNSRQNKPESKKLVRVNRVTDYMAKAIEEADLDQETFTALISAGDELHLFDNIKDPRKRPNSAVYSFKNILILTVLATIADGSCCPHSVHTHIKAKKEKYFELGLIPSLEQVPSHDVIEDLLAMADPEEIKNSLIDSIYEFISDLKSEIQGYVPDLMHLDGKEMRGTGRSKDTNTPSRNTNMVNLWEPVHGICSVSEPVDSRKNEIPKAQELLFKADLKGRYIAFDALHTQEDTLDLINFKKGWYIAPVKSNQKNALNHLKALFAEPKNTRFIKEETRAKRDFQILALSGKRKLEKFPHARYAVKMVSRVRSESEPVIMYFISNSTNVARVLDLICTRWDVENGLHQLKDSVVIGEDKFRCRNITAQKNIAILNNFIVALVRIIQSTEADMSLAVAKKKLRYEPLECLKLVCGMISDQEFRKLMKIGIKKETARQIGEGTFDWKTLA